MTKTAEQENSSAAGAAPLLPLAEVAPASTPRVPGGKPPHFVEELARKILRQGPEWKVCIWERLGDKTYLGCTVSGGVPRILTRGKRKGRESWSHIKRRDLHKLTISAAQEDEAKAEYEATTGNCRTCGGGGQEWMGWDHIKGTIYRPCSRCQATGNAPALTKATS